MTKYRKPVISDEQRANLEKLATYLENLPEDYQHFAMGCFLDSGLDEDEMDEVARSHTLTECGTAACAVGHGPNAGVRPHFGEFWVTYTDRAFITTAHDDEAWRWCFGSSWEFKDNTPLGAARRIRVILEKGVPLDSFEQRWHGAPLCYEIPRT